MSRQVAAAYHDKPLLRFVNLLPNYAEPKQWNEVNYTTYVDKFVSDMAAADAGPDVLCADYYPFFEFPSGSNLTTSIAGYRAALGVLRAVSLRANVPFWNFFK